ncbi:Protein kinase-like domain protein [Tolypocladium paradoxum]|uniref:EKC/KEOPS complex subunit BUD32 n=1 Tax=Tolypocladium paradoxum TaxID=94208 RepID=A0A2S4L1L5_9HYPO|nr:Protein kinase-like domain protein [Tolypocladium paradoxum]
MDLSKQAQSATQLAAHAALPITMLSIVARFIRVSFLTAVWQFAAGQCAIAWNTVLKLTGRRPKPPCAPIPQKPSVPRHILYRPIPGPWRRNEEPELPESAYQIPDDMPYGTICYVTKGRRVGRGATTHVEQLPSGHIVKYPKSNPYHPEEEEGHRRDMRTEVDVYRRIGDCPYVPRLIDWHPESCCLTLEYLENGDLGTFVTKEGGISAHVRQRWTLQAAAALKALHAVNVVHCDVTQRNFMLDGDLNLRIADFAGSSIARSMPTIAAGPRFRPPGWNWQQKAERAHDIFALGSVMYFIMVGVEPLSDLPEYEVERLFKAGRFPAVGHLVCGSVIWDCWDGKLDSAEQVMESLTASYAAA